MLIEAFFIYYNVLIVNELLILIIKLPNCNDIQLR